MSMGYYQCDGCGAVRPKAKGVGGWAVDESVQCEQCSGQAVAQ